MKKGLLILFIGLFSVTGNAQLLSWSPLFPKESSDPVVITVDASKGNSGLNNYANTSDVYVHTGVITSASTSNSDWRYVKYNQNFNTTNPLLQATYLGSNKWQFTIPGGINNYYGVPAGETILKIAILFRSGDGSIVQRNIDGSDMYIPIYTNAFAARLMVPFKQPTFNPVIEPLVKNIGDQVAINGISSAAANLKLYFNGNLIQTATGLTSITATPSPTITTTGTQTIILEASDGLTTKYDTINFYVANAVVVEALPAGVREGINYGTDNTKATFVLYAPNKDRVCLIGDMPNSNWTEQSLFQMKKTPDGNYWWIAVSGLTPGTEYSFQYLINGNLAVSDPYVEKVLDPWNDQYISSSTYPGLKPYPAGFTTGIVGIFQTSAPAYNWTTNGYAKPEKNKIVIYELLLRDFIAKHDWNTMRDTVSYLKNLGINAIELMPVNEFEGNLSWGYNPDFYFAPDKYYGPKNDFKQFIDICHANGIAVIMDIALNHSFGSSPMVQMYWDSANNRPSSSNPWFNPVAKHGFSVGFDFNHESLQTRYFVSRVMEHWLVNYKVDGFRFDLSKGFTQFQTCDNAGNNCNTAAMGAYDQSRINIWKRYYDTMQLKSPGSYPILEHFADNSEETVLADYGFLLWGNMNYNYTQASLGAASNTDLSYGIHSNRGWSSPHLVTYMESHDEERINYQNIKFGNAAGSYNIRDTNTARKRMELDYVFLLTIPGPKMILQFGEMGYDSSINLCQDGSTNNSCRLDPKPIRWNYLNVPERKNIYNVVSNLNRLRNNPIFSALFTSSNITSSLTGFFKWIKITQGDVSIMVMGNFGVTAQTATVTFPNAGVWKDYFNLDSITTNGAAQSVTLNPGEYKVYTNQYVAPSVSVINLTGTNNGSNNSLNWTVVNEQTVLNYQLQRSTNGVDYTSVTTTNAANLGTYNYSDNISSTTESFFYYRVKLVNNDGTYKYSNVVRITVISRNEFVEVAPNPFTDKLILNITADVQKTATITITDFIGRQIFKKQIDLTAGTNPIEIKEAIAFARGVYILNVTTATQKQQIKIIKGNKN